MVSGNNGEELGSYLWCCGTEHCEPFFYCYAFFFVRHHLEVCAPHSFTKTNTNSSNRHASDLHGVVRALVTYTKKEKQRTDIFARHGVRIHGHRCCVRGAASHGIGHGTREMAQVQTLSVSWSVLNPPAQQWYMCVVHGFAAWFALDAGHCHAAVFLPCDCDGTSSTSRGSRGVAIQVDAWGPWWRFPR